MGWYGSSSNMYIRDEARGIKYGQGITACMHVLNRLARAQYRDAILRLSINSDREIMATGSLCKILYFLVSGYVCRFTGRNESNKSAWLHHGHDIVFFTGMACRV